MAPSASKIIPIRVPEGEWKEWVKAAELAGLPLSTWCRAELHKARMRAMPPLPPKTYVSPGGVVAEIESVELRPDKEGPLKKVVVKKPKTPKTAEVCAHRVPKTMFCKRCSG